MFQLKIDNWEVYAIGYDNYSYITVLSDTRGASMLCLNVNGVPINEDFVTGTLFSVRQNKPFGLQLKLTGAWYSMYFVDISFLFMHSLTFLFLLWYYFPYIIISIPNSNSFTHFCSYSFSPKIVLLYNCLRIFSISLWKARFYVLEISKFSSYSSAKIVPSCNFYPNLKKSCVNETLIKR